jgi:hypothetical protein
LRAWLRRLSIVALVVVAVVSIAPSVEAGRDDQSALSRTVGSTSDRNSTIGGDPAWHVTDSGWALMAGNAASGRVDNHSRPRELAGGMDIGAAITLGATVLLAGVLVLVVRRRRRLS